MQKLNDDALDAITGGKGEKPMITCPKCKGEKKQGRLLFKTACTLCNGTGEIPAIEISSHC